MAVELYKIKNGLKNDVRLNRIFGCIKKNKQLSVTRVVKKIWRWDYERS